MNSSFEAVRDHWITRAELERAVGGNLSPGGFGKGGRDALPRDPASHVQRVRSER